MAKREKTDRVSTLGELMQYREYLANHWPDLEKKDDKWYTSLDKLAIHLPEWVLGVSILVGLLLFAYFPYLESAGQILSMLCLALIIYRRGIERG
jgi:hypothetical protein